MPSTNLMGFFLLLLFIHLPIQHFLSFSLFSIQDLVVHPCLLVHSSSSQASFLDTKIVVITTKLNIISLVFALPCLSWQGFNMCVAQTGLELKVHWLCHLDARITAYATMPRKHFIECRSQAEPWDCWRQGVPALLSWCFALYESGNSR